MIHVAVCKVLIVGMEPAPQIAAFRQVQQLQSLPGAIIRRADHSSAVQYATEAHSRRARQQHGLRLIRRFSLCLPARFIASATYDQLKTDNAACGCEARI